MYHLRPYKAVVEPVLFGSGRAQDLQNFLSPIRFRRSRLGRVGLGLRPGLGWYFFPSSYMKSFRRVRPLFDKLFARDSNGERSHVSNPISRDPGRRSDLIRPPFVGLHRILMRQGNIYIKYTVRNVRGKER
jgi:hypothetical protein